jgi:competence protein ComEC
MAGAARLAETFADWVEAERGRFILFLPVAMAAAILVYFDLPAEPPLWLAAALPAAAGAALAAVWRWPPARFAAALLLAAALGFGRAEWRTAAAPPLIAVPYGAPLVTGAIVAVDLLPVGRRVTLAAASLNGAAPLPRTLRIRLRNDDPAPLTVGQTVSLRAKLFRPDRPAYPGAWDFGRDAYFQGLGASGFALGDVTVTAPAPPDAWADGTRHLREAIAARILATLPVATGSIAVTLLTGFEQVIPPPERQDFITAGLAHILAVAGLHVGIVMGLVFAATRFLLTRSERLTLRLNVKAVAAVAALAGGAAYAALTGAHLPILRSLAMASLVTIGVLAGRRAISLRGLALAATLIMLATPEAVVGTSFQMSFAAVAALIAGYEAAGDFFARFHRGGVPARLAGHVIALGFTSLLAGGASMPFAAYQFQQVQPYWILANLIAVPLSALWIMPFGLAALALMPFGLAAFALLPMGWGIAVIVWLTVRISAWPDALLRIAPMPDAAILWFAAGLAWLCLLRSKLRIAGLAPMLLGAGLYASARPPDVLIAPDARLIAIRSPPQILLLREPRAESYTLAAWGPVWRGARLRRLDPADPPAGVACDSDGCTLASVYIALAQPQAGCPAAALVVSPVPLRGACDASGRVVIDRFSVWRDGAIAIWLGPDGAKTLSDRRVQGSRPWVPPWPERRWGTTLD